MGTVNVNLGEASKLNLILGQQLENAVTSVVFDFSAWQTAYGSGTLGLSVQRPGDDQPYAVTMTVSGTNATWSITSLDTAYKGVGEIQVTYTVGSVVKKSVVYKFTVYKSLGENGEYPSPGQSWQEGIEDELAEVEQDLKTEILRENYFKGFKSGFYSGADGSYNSTRKDYICTVEPIPLTFREYIYWNWYAFNNIVTLYMNCFDANMGYIGSKRLDHASSAGDVAIIHGASLYNDTALINTVFVHLSLTAGGATLTPSDYHLFELYKTFLSTSKLLSLAIENTSPYILNMVNVTYNSNLHTLIPTTSAVGLTNPIKVISKSEISVAENYQMAVIRFSSDTASGATFISDTGWVTSSQVVDADEYITIALKKSNGSDILPSKEVLSALTIRPLYINDDALIRKIGVTFTKGTFSADGTILGSGNGAVSSRTINPQYINIYGSAHSILALYKGTEYLGKLNANGVLDKVAGSWYWFDAGTHDITGYLETYGADSIVVCTLPTDSTSITSETVQTWGNIHCTITKDVYVTHEYAENNFTKKIPFNTSNYIIGSDLMKKYVDVNLLGTLTYLQAFCKYDNNYYSINGTNIGIQDSSFNEVSNTALSTGHGNSLQLGNSKYAYASGWDDQKIYKVDLDNLTIDDTITLPTTGYTTGCVDEDKGVVYIFQRDSYPDHEDNYNFIVYDYINEEIKSTKKILAYGAMQACDLHNDRIFVLNGLGNNTCPNGFRVFDTNGNILADYYLGYLDTAEPEGVCLDRDTHELLVSISDRRVFKISV